MILFHAGARYSTLSALPKPPGNMMFTYEDLGPYGIGEQKKLFTVTMMARGYSGDFVLLGKGWPRGDRVEISGGGVAEG